MRVTCDFVLPIAAGYCFAVYSVVLYGSFSKGMIDYGGIFFMKIKSVIAGAAAMAVMSCANICAFADDADTEILLAAVPADNARAAAAGTEAETAEGKAGASSGVEGVAAVFGTIALAGAAVVISRKKA